MAVHPSLLTWLSLNDLRQHLNPAGMDLSHARRELQRKVASTEMDIEQRGLHAAMSGETCNLVDVPACMG